jgi:hypothetical protein
VLIYRLLKLVGMLSIPVSFLYTLFSSSELSELYGR